MEYNARVCNHKYTQHEGEVPRAVRTCGYAEYSTHVQGDSRQCVVISATTGQYICIALTTVQYGIYCTGGNFDLRHRCMGYKVCFILYM